MLLTAIPGYFTYFVCFTFQMQWLLAIHLAVGLPTSLQVFWNHHSLWGMSKVQKCECALLTSVNCEIEQQNDIQYYSVFDCIKEAENNLICMRTVDLDMMAITIMTVERGLCLLAYK